MAVSPNLLYLGVIVLAYLVCVALFCFKPAPSFEDEPAPWDYPNEWNEVCMNPDYTNPPDICFNEPNRQSRIQDRLAR